MASTEYHRQYMREYRKRQRLDPVWNAKARYKNVMSVRKHNGMDVGTILRKQPKKCEVCKSPPGKRSLHADHDHVSRKFRGWLCNRCNWLLGALENVGDGKKLVRKLIRFVKVESANNVGVVLTKEQLKALHLHS